MIDKFVLCPKCKLPEISIITKKGKDDIKGKCRACGNISKLDDKHKFSTYIRNFPPKYDTMDAKPLIDTSLKTIGKVEDTKPKAGIDKETKEKMSKYCFLLRIFNGKDIQNNECDK
jgi:hypothetical protein